MRMACVAVTLALLALASRQSLAQDCDCSPAMSFSSQDVTQYGISKGSPEELQSITACFWMSVPMRTAHKNLHSTPLSYATKTSRFGNDFTFILMPDLVLLSDKYRFRLVIIVETTGSKPNHRALIIHMPSMFRTGVRFDDGMLHHVCVTWESSSGALKVYKDGVLVKTLNNVLTGEVIRSGGTWMIGQSQDQERRDRFEGTLVGVNIWNRVLCDYEVERVAEDCGSLIQGNYKSYKDFTMSDTVEFITPSCCPSESQASP